jgi:AAA+ superfamily predicted ATPase
MRSVSVALAPLKSLDISESKVVDNSQEFLQMKMLTYMYRFLDTNQNFDRECFQLQYWLLGHELSMVLLESIIALRGDKIRHESIVSEEDVDDGWDFGRCCREMVKLIPKNMRNRVVINSRNLLKQKLEDLKYRGSTTIEENIQAFRKVLNLDDTETELCLFLFLISSYEPFSDFFQNHLRCTSYKGRRLLGDILEFKESDIARVITGKLYQMGVVDRENNGSFGLEPAFGLLLQDLNHRDIRTNFFKQVEPDSIPLKFHTVDKNTTKHILNQLKYKPETSTHILLYGPPGTGKTSYANGLAKKLGLTMYLLEHSDKENSTQRRAAIAACINVAKETDGAVILADDCDSILNTENSWSMFGERSDKRWLHEILETPGVRMLWIVNSIEHLEESVSRRFSFSLKFKSFNKLQRVQVWNNSVKNQKVGRFLTNEAIEDLANRYSTSPGVIEQVIRKAKESKKYSDVNFRSSVVLALESHISLLNGGYSSKEVRSTDKNFTLDGLNLISTDAKALLDELSGFNEYSKKPLKHGPVSMSLLFYGPSGTGKSALARFIASHLDKEIVVKRASDLFSKWVGETEQNIRDAYEEAQSKKAVLIFDEADSLIFNRDRANNSWELSFTNEFLTWMETYQGIQIFTTNRLKDLDNASLRRFNHKVEFGYLKPDGNIIFYNKFFASLLGREPDRNTLLELKSLCSLTPGDFKTVRDRYVFRNKDKISEKEILNALHEEAKIRNLHGGMKSIGFV